VHQQGSRLDVICVGDSVDSYGNSHTPLPFGWLSPPERVIARLAGDGAGLKQI